MEISAQLVNELRQKTQISVMECKKALVECNGDMNKAIDFLRKKGLSVAEQKSSRAVKDGMIVSYIHSNNKVGVLVEILCETDFVAKSDEFKKLGKEIAMQIAASSPKYLSKSDIPKGSVDKEISIYREQFSQSGKPEKVIENIISGKMDKFYEQVCLLEQVYIRDEKLKIKDLIAETISKLGENIKIGRFIKFELGQNIIDSSN